MTDSLVAYEVSTYILLGLLVAENIALACLAYNVYRTQVGSVAKLIRRAKRIKRKRAILV